MEHRSTEKRKRRVKVPFYAFAVYLLLLSAVLSGVTFSKYVTGTAVGNTARVALMKDITVSETGGFTQQDKPIITPGVNLTKNFTVRFEGSEMACYVFLKIGTTGWEQIGDYSFACRVDGIEALAWSVDETVWKFLSSDGGDAVYYAVVSANETFEASVQANGGTIAVSKDLTRTQLEKLTSGLAAELSIDIEATAMQYHGVEEVMKPEYDETERAKTAWDIVKVK